MSQEKIQNAKNLLFMALGIDILVTAVVAISDLWAVSVMKGIQSGSSTPDQTTIQALSFWEVFSTATILTVIGVGLAIVRWIHACYEYAKVTLKATGFVQERWIAWGWVLPILNLFKPYQVLGEIYRAGAPGYVSGDEWKKSSGSGVLLIWWIFWVIAHIVIFSMWKAILFKKGFGDGMGLNEIIGMLYVSVGTCVISIIVAGLWFLMAGRLTDRLLSRSVPNLDSGTAVHIKVANEFSIPHDATSTKVASSESSRTDPLRAPVAEVPNAVISTPLPRVVDEDAVYADIAKELEGSVADKGLWVRLFADCDGDEKRARVLYIRQRAERLITAERRRLEHAARDNAAEAAMIEERNRQIEAALQRMKVDKNKLESIRAMADRHVSNPRRPIEEQVTLLKYAGGSFVWHDHSQCSATFLDEEKRFSSGKEFSNWFLSDVLPILIAVCETR